MHLLACLIAATVTLGGFWYGSHRAIWARNTARTLLMGFATFTFAIVGLIVGITIGG